MDGDETGMLSRLLVCGFGWTGSGALIDCIRDTGLCVGFRPDFEEGSCLKGRYSFAYLYRKLEQGQAILADDIISVLNAQRGLRLSSEMYPANQVINIKRNEHIRAAIGPEEVDSVLRMLEKSLLEKCVPGTREYQGNAEEFLALVTEYIYLLAEQSANKQENSGLAKYQVFNNDPAGYSVDLFRFLPDAKVTVVTRNLVDVYATRVAMGKHADTFDEAQKFVIEHEKKLRGFCSKAAKESVFPVRANLRLVAFEDFVLSESVRRRWMDWIGLDYVPAPTRFDPDMSRKNIGIGEHIDGVSFDLIKSKLEDHRIKDLKESGVSFVRA
jgi:hypothetical protein